MKRESLLRGLRNRILQLLARFADLVHQTRFLFAYGFASADGESPELKWLTSGSLSSVTSMGAGRKQFTVDTLDSQS
jgi:hypothetical protein